VTARTIEHVFTHGGDGDVRGARALSDDELQAAFAIAHRRWLRAGAERLRLLAEVERRRLYRRDGHLSAHAWLASAFGESAGTARSDVRVAVALEEMPSAREAVASGEVSPSAVRMLVQARSEHPDAFDEDEARLVRQAVADPADATRRRLAEWAIVVDEREGVDRAERLHERRHLAVVPTEAGMVRIAGELDPVGAEPVVSALRAVVDSGRRTDPHDHRTTGQRWADALSHLGVRFLASPDGPSVGGERPHIAITVDLDALRSGQGSASFDHSGPAPVSSAKLLACDAAITRVVLSPRSEPLDVGRRTPVVSSALRRALVARDGGCRFPSCDRPPGWADAHHVTHWAAGGATALGNLVLLCRGHHRMVHGGLASVSIVDGHVCFRSLDGSTIPDRRRAPP
jgi:hypothetical protein